MGRIEGAFEKLKQKGERALIPFLTAGDPDLETTERLIHALVESGADLIELGIPFSDPMADGPVIQAASERALAAGTDLAGILRMIERIREHTNIPLILMGYYNPIFCYGVERFARDAAEAGVDALLLVDLPPEEDGEIRPHLRNRGIHLITLLAPTTPSSRRESLASRGEGFIYYVSMTGVTGTQKVNTAGIRKEVEELRTISPVPVAVGFGISSPEDAAGIAEFADGVVVGSALVKIIGTYGKSSDLLPQVGDFIRSLKDAVAGSDGDTGLKNA